MSDSHSQSGRRRRLGALVVIAVMTAFAAFGLSGATGRVAASTAPDGGGSLVGPVPAEDAVKTVPLGTEEECNKRVAPDPDGPEYCSDIFLTLHDLDAYWKEQFPKLVTKNQKYSPPDKFSVGVPPVANLDCAKPPKSAVDYCNDPAHWDFDGKGTTEIYFAETSFLSFHKSGDFSTAVALAHEWGHHIQHLMGPLQQTGLNTYTIHSELQADCYAGAWANYEDKNLDQLEKGDVDEALNLMYVIGDARVGSWDDENAHGYSEQRVLSFRTGYEFGDPKACEMWTLFDGTQQPLLNLGKYALAIAPPDVVDEQDFGYSVSAGDGIVSFVMPLTKLGKGTAKEQFNDVFKTAWGTSGRPLDLVTTQDLPARGKLPQSEADKATSYAQTFEVTADAKQLHGIMYVNVRSGGGDGVALMVFTNGAAGKADFKPLALELRFLLMGLSVKNGGAFTFQGGANAGGIPSLEDADVAAKPIDLTNADGDSEDPGIVLHDRGGGGR